MANVPAEDETVRRKGDCSKAGAITEGRARKLSQARGNEAIINGQYDGRGVI